MAKGVARKCLEFVLVQLLVLFWTSVMRLRLLKVFLTQGPNAFTAKPRPTLPAVLASKEWEHGYVKVSEVKLHYVHAGDVSKPLLILLHGFPEFWYTWRKQIRFFKKDYYVIAVDMRGYANSAKPPLKSDYTMDKVATDIMEIVYKFDRENCFLVGHDWGAAIAWEVATRYPKIVKKLVILNVPHPAAFDRQMNNGYSQLLKSWYMFFFQCPFLPEIWLRMNDLNIIETWLTVAPTGAKNKDAFTPEDIEAWKYTFSQDGALTPPLNYYRNIFNSPEPNTETKVQPPVLIIWGTEDAYLDKEMAEMSVDYCRVAEVKFIEGASHWVQNDEPDICNRYIHEFIST